MKSSSRYGWIAACLAFAGRFGPKEKRHLRDYFGISAPTVSRDQAVIASRLAEFEGEAVRTTGGKIETLDTSALPDFSDLDVPPVDEWLRVMLGARHVVVHRPERAAPRPEILCAMVRSVEDRRAVYILDVSQSAPEPMWRAVSPHAIINIAGRYHMRCFDHGKQRFGDFVLARMLAVTFDRTDTPPYKSGQSDEDWTSDVQVKISLTDEGSPLIGRLDFGIDESGYKIIRLRKALAPYIIDKRTAGFEDLIQTELVT